uniref:Gustatory receptor n=1 Tax=Anopheles christyi TaxID=43041 RepID=A0A182JPJ1_9DIPT
MSRRHVHYDRRFGSVYPLFQLLGFTPVPLHGQALTSLRTLTCVFVSFYITVEIIFLSYSLIKPEDVFFLSDATGTFADAIQFVIPLTVPLASLVLSLFKRSTQKRIALLMDEIDRSMEVLGTIPGSLERFNHQLADDILTNMLIYNLIPAVSEFFIISRIPGNPIWYRNWLLKVWFFILIRLGDSFFLVHVLYLRNRYQFLNDELHQLASTKARDISTEAIHRRLVHLKAIQNRLKDLTGEVSDRFGWQLFAVITMLFICTTIDGYWMYASLHHDGNLYKVESFMCGISPVLMFFVLFNTCQKCVDVQEMTFYHLHSVLNRTLPNKSITLIESFSKQLHNEQVYFSAANFFDIRLSSLTTTYAGTGAPLGSTLALLWCTGNCILYVGVLTFCVTKRRWLFADTRTGTGINFIPFIKSSFTLVTHLVVLLEAFLARGIYRALDVRVTSVDGALRELTDTARPSLARARAHFRNKLLLFGVFCCVIELGILALGYSYPVQLVIWCLTVPSLVIIRLKHLHHAYHIDRLTARFDILREQMESLAVVGISPGHREPLEYKLPPKATSLNRWKMNGSTRPAVIDALPVHRPLSGAVTKSLSIGATSSSDQLLLRRIFVAKSTYLTLWHASKDLNGCCVYSQLANLLQNFIQCTCDLYSLYALLYLNQLDDIFGFILSIVATFTALGVVLAACENCKNQVSQMAQLLYKRHGDETDLLAKMIAAAITTYMVIFIQFMPKEDPAADPTNASMINAALANGTTTVTPV